jgi:hypothetical protein
MTEPRYSIGTWDTEAPGFTPHPGLKAFNLTRTELVEVMRELRGYGYTCHRIRDRDQHGVHTGDTDSDVSVLIERTDGMPEADILRQWER